MIRFLSTPSARRATRVVAVVADPDLFLSTPSARRATPAFCGLGRALVFLSTPSARRATETRHIKQTGVVISIHALREEGDHNQQRGVSAVKISIHALREEGDVRRQQRTGGGKISIHALREEGDRMSPTSFSRSSDFYPRPPRGGRLSSTILESPRRSFLSTPSARRATTRC